MTRSLIPHLERRPAAARDLGRRRPYDLNSLVVQSLDGWTINGVTSINNLGQMTALATRNDVMKPVVLNPVK